MNFIHEVDPTSLDGMKKELSVTKSVTPDEELQFDPGYYTEDENDDYYLFQFGVGGPA